MLQVSGVSLNSYRRNDVGRRPYSLCSPRPYSLCRTACVAPGLDRPRARTFGIARVQLSPIYIDCNIARVLSPGEMRGWTLALLLLWGVYCRGSAAQNETLAASSQLLTGAEITNGTMLTVCTSDVPPLVCWGEPVDANL